MNALEFAHAEIRKIVAAIRELHKRVNPEKVKVTPPAFDEGLYNEIKSKYGERLRDALDTAKHPKSESYGLVDTIKAEIMASIPEDDEHATNSHIVRSSGSASGFSVTICCCDGVARMLGLSIKLGRLPVK